MIWQGIEVVSAKLFISYNGSNTAKDFKVRQNTKVRNGKSDQGGGKIWSDSSGDDQSWSGGSRGSGESWPNQLSLLSHKVDPSCSKTLPFRDYILTSIYYNLIHLELCKKKILTTPTLRKVDGRPPWRRHPKLQGSNSVKVSQRDNRTALVKIVLFLVSAFRWY